MIKNNFFSKFYNQKISYLLILILFILFIFTLINNFSLRERIRALQNSKFQVNQKILLFTEKFIDKVIKTDKEVSAEERLELENDLREINDSQITEAWERFVLSKDEDEAQKNVKNLLAILLRKIREKTE
jgi:flagellar biosynthesis/type III secretory pathway M-ring protein FliF/YscJ